MELQTPDRVREPSPADACPLMASDYGQSSADEETVYIPVSEYLLAEDKHEQRLMRLSVGTDSFYCGHSLSPDAAREMLRGLGSCPGTMSSFSSAYSGRSEDREPMTPGLASSPSSTPEWGLAALPGYLQVVRQKRPSPEPSYMSPTKYQKLSSSDESFSYPSSTSSLSLHACEDGQLAMRHQYLDERLRGAGFDGLGGYMR